MESFFEEMDRIQRHNRKLFLGWLCIAGAILILALFLIGHALARPPENAAAKYSDWYKEQVQLDNPYLTKCCGGPEDEGGDGRIVATKLEMGQWYVWIVEKQQWLPYPRAVDPTLQNPIGASVLWLTFGEDGSINWFCLRVSIGI